MPHDKNGTLIAAGDEVLLRARVKQVQPSEEACNVDLELLDTIGSGEHCPAITCNAKLVEKLYSGKTA